MEFAENLDVGCFLKTMVSNFFKRCRIINFCEDYKYTERQKFCTYPRVLKSYKNVFVPQNFMKISINAVQSMSDMSNTLK